MGKISHEKTTDRFKNLEDEVEDTKKTMSDYEESLESVEKSLDVLHAKTTDRFFQTKIEGVKKIMLDHIGTVNKRIKKQEDERSKMTVDLDQMMVQIQDMFTQLRSRIDNKVESKLQEFRDEQISIIDKRSC